jgi:hypothetical protein
MSIRNPQPVRIQGVEYGLLAVNLAMSSRVEGEEMATDINAKFTPYRNRGNRPPQISESGEFTLNISAALNDKAKNIKTTDPELARLLNTIENAFERYLGSRVQ